MISLSKTVLADNWLTMASTEILSYTKTESRGRPLFLMNQAWLSRTTVSSPLRYRRGSSRYNSQNARRASGISPVRNCAMVGIEVTSFRVLRYRCTKLPAGRLAKYVLSSTLLCKISAWIASSGVGCWLNEESYVYILVGTPALRVCSRRRCLEAYCSNCSLL